MILNKKISVFNKIYVNYNQKQITVDDVTVKALDYEVVGANGSIVG